MEGVFASATLDAEQLASEQFVGGTVQQVRDYQQRLQQAKAAAAEQLKTSVYADYNKFIGTSREVAHVEADMLELRNLLADYTAVLRAVELWSSASPSTSTSADAAVDAASGSAAAALLNSSKQRAGASTPAGQQQQQHQQQRRNSASSGAAAAAVEELTDQLDAAIAERRFERAVTLIETAQRQLQQARAATSTDSTGGGESQSAAAAAAAAATRGGGGGAGGGAAVHHQQQQLQQLLDSRVRQLGELLGSELRHEALRSHGGGGGGGAGGVLGETRRTVRLLCALGLERQARELFLSSRTARIERQQRRLQVDTLGSSTSGDQADYLRLMLGLVFRAIRQAWRDFQAAFGASSEGPGPSGVATARFVVWAVGEVAQVADALRSQVLGQSLLDFQAMQQCLHIALVHCRLLEDEGLAVEGVLRGRMQAHLEAALAQAVANAAQAVPIAHDSWVPMPVTFPAPEAGAAAPVLTESTGPLSISLTESAKYLYSASQALLLNCLALLSPEMVGAVSAQVAGLYEGVLRQIVPLVDDTARFSDAQRVAMVGTSKFVVHHVAPSFVRHVEHGLQRLGCRSRELDLVRRRVTVVHKALVSRFATRTAVRLINDKLLRSWPPAAYGQETIASSAGPSAPFVELLKAVAQLRTLLLGCMSARQAAGATLAVLSACLHTLLPPADQQQQQQQHDEQDSGVGGGGREAAAASFCFWQPLQGADGGGDGVGAGGGGGGGAAGAGLGDGGLQQLVLDLRLLLELLVGQAALVGSADKTEVTELAAAAVQRAIEKSLALRAAKLDHEPDLTLLKSEQWFSKRIADAMAKLGKDFA